MQKTPQPYEIYKHFKGNLYQVLTLASDSETTEVQVVYQSLYHPFAVWVRPLSMFMSEVDHEKYPEVTQYYRFELQQASELVVTDVTLLRKTMDKQLDNMHLVEDICKEEELIQIEETVVEIKMEEDSKDIDFDELVLDPLVLAFLDSDTYEEKLNVLTAMHQRITDEMINTLAIAMDVEVEAGDIEERYMQLRNCLSTLKKYECNRLR